MHLNVTVGIALFFVTFVVASLCFCRDSKHDANVAPGVNTDPDAGGDLDY